MSSLKASGLILFFGLVGAASYVALYTDLGVFLVGHRYWMGKAAHAKTAEATITDLHRVVQATQYGVNQAQSWTRDHPHSACRIRIWRQLVQLAPSENWRHFYSTELKKDLISLELEAKKPDSQN